MGYGKWIGGLMGFMTMGPLGALAGFAIGSLFDNANANENMTGDSGQQDEFMGQRNSFLFSMLVMASYIIRADGRIMHSEMEYVRNFLRNNFGEAAVSEGEQILLNLFEQRKQMDKTNPMAFRNTINQCGQQIAENMTYEERLQLLSFLAQIAKSDGNVCKTHSEQCEHSVGIQFYVDERYHIQKLYVKVLCKIVVYHNKKEWAYTILR